MSAHRQVHELHRVSWSIVRFETTPPAFTVCTPNLENLRRRTRPVAIARPTLPPNANTDRLWWGSAAAVIGFVVGLVLVVARLPAGGWARATDAGARSDRPVGGNGLVVGFNAAF